jgi:hypothetical protein
MGRNSRRRRGELSTGWNFTHGATTVPIRTEADFHAALTWILGGDDDDAATTETSTQQGKNVDTFYARQGN